MARADLLKKLFRSYKFNDNESFIKAAELIIDEERKKNHLVLADELKRILYSEHLSKPKSISVLQTTQPKDLDKNAPLFEVKFPDKFFNDLIVAEDIKENLMDILKDYLHWDALVSNGLKPNNKLLFYGPPGCGKTITAEALAGELGLPLLYIRFDAVISSFLGETSTNIRKIFDYASSGSWIIFFDEFDAIGRSRADDGENSEIKRVVNAFLQLMDNFTGRSIIVAATNYEKVLDHALWRRFTEIIKFDLPTADSIHKLLLTRLSRFAGPEQKLVELSNELCGYSQADIERVCQNVLKRCIMEGRTYYTKFDLDRAVSKEADRKKAQNQ
ncbi:AAA family ATPase [Paenibacillus sp.]|uniref:AAA family ATPase n=1 Tax=Paenibacillus sp. TaxID=58172 RepID=UPI002D5FFDD0|nr:AAA family ATPase [Paenibacillus sp.]HZG84865.1 AAA family ATPase [Paenibacillus sp.]